MSANDAAFQMITSTIRFGPGITREAGYDLADLGTKRVLLVIDPAVRKLPAGDVVQAALRSAGVGFEVFDAVHCEPTDQSVRPAIAAAQEMKADAFLAVGGGSTIDTAKIANLYSTYPADLLDYVARPVGAGKPVPGPLKPLVAIPTTSGTGSETTGVAIFDMLDLHVKTGISHRYLRPTLGLLDPENTWTMPCAVVACTGLDVISHALESYTAVPYERRPKPERPSQRTMYQGSNPISDVWSIEALRLSAKYLRRAVADASDSEARGQMLLASGLAGIGFGNAGVHLPHAMSYPVAGMVREFRPAGYSADHAIVPHGMAVILNAPAVFRFIASTCPERHLEGARVLGADVRGATAGDAGEVLADCLIGYMKDLGQPRGLEAIGYTEEDIPALIKGTLAQERITQLSPRPATESDYAAMFADSMRLW